MLRKLLQVKNYKFYQDFEWPRGLPDFEKITVIYGPNGTGKTTLSSLLLEIKDKDNTEALKKVCVELSESRERITVKRSWHESFGRIHVLSDKYVRDNQLLNASESIGMPAILTVGERNVEKELQLNARRKDLQALNEKVIAKRKIIKEAERHLNSTLSLLSEQIVNNVYRAGGKFRSRSTYHVGYAKNRLNEIDRKTDLTLSDEEYSECITVVNSDPPESLEFHPPTLLLSDVARLEINELLASQPRVSVLDSLEKCPEASQWVQDGQRFHIDQTNCLFCGNPFTRVRREQIAEHFSATVTKLQEEIRKIRRAVQGEADLIASSFATLPKSKLVAITVRQEYEREVKKLAVSIDERTKWTYNVTQHLTKKLENILTPVETNASHVPSVSFDAVARVLDKHNKLADSNRQQVQAAASRVEKHVLFQHLLPYQRAMQYLKEEKSEISSLNDRVRKLEGQISELERVDGDPLPTSQTMNREVSRMLGRDELTFDLNNGQYAVNRNGAPVSHLSQGELTAIMAVHFVESVVRANGDGRKPIVVIDDPVSSLDSSVFTGVSTYLWSELATNQNVEQVILLTHNFELFRQWDIQIDKLPKKKFPAALYELKSIYKDSGGQLKRHPQLSSWPMDKQQRELLRSSYIHSFSLLVNAFQKLKEDASAKNLLEAQLLYPNMMRRVLETFLAFRQPDSIGNFTASMRKAAQSLQESNYTGDATALQLLITRFSHTHSHSSTPEVDVTFPPEEVTAYLRACFHLMDALDSEHFARLCQTIGVSSVDLLESSK